MSTESALNELGGLGESIAIRPLRRDDLEKVRLLFVRVNRALAPPSLHDAFESYIALALREKIDRLDVLYDAADGHGFWVAMLDHRLAGMVGLKRENRSTAEIRSMSRHFNRRRFLSGVASGSAAACGIQLGAPAMAQELPTLRWRLTSGFPNSLDTICGGATFMAEALVAITGGKFRIQVFQAGEILPGPQAIDAVQANTVEIAHTCGYYFTGKNPTFAIGSTIPSGLNSRQQNAWLYHGGGNELYNQFLADYGVVGIPGGNTGAQIFRE